MKLIVGLGNPGKTYAETRHNVGYMVVDWLAAQNALTNWRKRFRGLATEGVIGTQRVVLLKPETYMNDSGWSVQEAMAWSKLSPTDVMIICDDFHLPLGRIRVRGNGSAGGHNGLDSVLTLLGTQDVPRLRIGIGETLGRRDRDFVLAPFAAQERSVVAQAVEWSAKAVQVWLEHGLTRCQNEFNKGPDASSGQAEKEADA